MFEPDPSELELEVLVAPETTLILYAAIVEPLRAANRVMGRRLYSWRVTSFDGAEVATASGVPIPVAGAFDPSGRQPLLVAGSYNIGRYAGRGIVSRLARAARPGRTIGGIEAGGWLLGHAGLLNGYRATTHWEDIDAFTTRFPDVEVTGRRFVRDRTRLTTAGSAPTIDLMLELIRFRQGDARAMDVARLLNYEPGVSSAVQGEGRVGLRDAQVARAATLMDRNLEEPLSIRTIARQAGLSTRQLQSRFNAALGMGPQAHYLGLRIGEARRLLIETRMPVLEIAAATGFSSPAGFARAYRRLNGESPSETRRQSR
ncbi:GlxA family transcriptional regulator [Rhodobacteraceae bacterium NNCM2]|nr:GlxA family transcriptional regulator [Coraliihabitans acroporae]